MDFCWPPFQSSLFGGAKATKPHHGRHFRIHFLLFILTFCCLQHTLHGFDASMLTKALYTSNGLGFHCMKLSRVIQADLEGFLLELSLPPRFLFSLCFFDFVFPTCRHMVSRTSLQARLS